MITGELCRVWLKNMADSHTVLQIAIEEWFRQGVRRWINQAESRLPTEIAVPPFAPFEHYVREPEDILRLLIQLRDLSADESSPNVVIALRKAIVEVTKSWNYQDERLYEAISLCFEICAHLGYYEICDDLARRKFALLEAPTSVITRMSDMAATMSQGVNLLDLLCEAAGATPQYSHLVLYLVTRRLELCAVADLRQQRLNVMAVIKQHRKKISLSEDALFAFEALTDCYCEQFRCSENNFEADEIEFFWETYYEGLFCSEVMEGVIVDCKVPSQSFQQQPLTAANDNIVKLLMTA